jgi:hypothetical protein
MMMVSPNAEQNYPLAAKLPRRMRRSQIKIRRFVSGEAVLKWLC